MRGGLINVVCDLNSTSSVVTLAYLAAIPGHLSEVNLNKQFRIIGHPTSDQLNACFCTRSTTSSKIIVLATNLKNLGLLLFLYRVVHFPVFCCKWEGFGIVQKELAGVQRGSRNTKLSKHSKKI